MSSRTSELIRCPDHGHTGPLWPLPRAEMPADALDAGEITQVIGVKSNHVPFVGFLWTSSMELKRIVLSP